MLVALFSTLLFSYAWPNVNSILNQSSIYSLTRNKKFLKYYSYVRYAKYREKKEKKGFIIRLGISSDEFNTETKSPAVTKPF